MSGKVPLSNARFINSPDFDSQAISGITGSGVFRQFSANAAGVSTWTVTSSDLWTTIHLTGNSIVTIPSGISNITIGDEILFVNETGTISFTMTGGATLLSDSLYTVYAARPARLIYAGSNSWILAGAKTSYSEATVLNCCDDSQASLYTLGTLSPETLAYSDRFGSAVYTFSGVGGVCKVGATAYNIQSGVVTESSCDLVDFTSSYTLYAAPDYLGTSLFAYTLVDIFDDAQIMSTAFKSASMSDVYPCDLTYAVNGTYYRSYGLYGALYPVCFSNGRVIAATSC
jgi:hypothetical protein